MSDAVRDLGEDHVTALLAAYRTLEAAQGAPLPPDLAARLAQAERSGWQDVAFALHYAERSHQVDAGVYASEALGRMRRVAEAAGDAAMLATVLAEGAAYPSSDGDGEPDGDDERLDDDLARAVALLGDGDGHVLVRPGAYIACAQGYRLRRLWEIEAELFDLAEAELEREVPPGLEAVPELTRNVVVFHQVEVDLELACDAYEVGERDLARSFALRRPPLTAQQRLRLPETWAIELAAMEALLTALGGRPQVWSTEVLGPQAARSPWPGYGGCLLLADAVRALDAGEPQMAAELAEQAIPLFTDDRLPAVVTLALHVAAQVRPVVPAAQRYGRALAVLRRQSRQREVRAARARLREARLTVENERLARHALTDELTGLDNRHALARHLDRLRGAGDRDAGGGVAVLLVDVDHFKGVNDGFGHPTGDEVLRRVAAILRDLCRIGDVAARLGGDEFLAVLLDCGHRQAARRAQECVERVVAHPWSELAEGLRVTVSVGSASGPAWAIDEVMKAADVRLYAAKDAGRGTSR